MSVILEHTGDDRVCIMTPNIRIDNPHHSEDPYIYGEIQRCVAYISAILDDGGIELNEVHDISTIQGPELVLRIRTASEISEDIRTQILTRLHATEKEPLKPAIIGGSHADESHFNYLLPVPIPGTWTIRIPPRTTSNS